MNRNDMGAWCGYVVLPVDHICHGVDMDTLPYALHRAAHGSITLSARHRNRRDWVIGFDCAHAFDIVPWMALNMPLIYDQGLSNFDDMHHYWTYEEVRQEVETLAEAAETIQYGGYRSNNARRMAGLGPAPIRKIRQSLRAGVQHEPWEVPPPPLCLIVRP